VNSVDVRQATHVRVGKTGDIERIASIWGIDPNGQLAKPSEGGFGVITTSGRRVSMWEAFGYFRDESAARQAAHECSVPLRSGGSIRFPARPEPASYVRVVSPSGDEVAYWGEAEFRGDFHSGNGSIPRRVPRESTAWRWFWCESLTCFRRSRTAFSLAHLSFGNRSWENLAGGRAGLAVLSSFHRTYANLLQFNVFTRKRSGALCSMIRVNARLRL
jgi:hypothetical protein